MRAAPSLYYVTDPSQTRELTFAMALSAARSGASYVQLRCKSLAREAILQQAYAIQKAIADYEAHFIINDFVDIALDVDTDGVHLGQSDGSVIEARRILGTDKIIGLTVDSWAELEAAQALPIDYIGLSSLFPSITKCDISYVWGWEGLKRALSFSSIPLVPIGGITMAEIPALAQMPIHAVAVTSILSRAPHPNLRPKALSDCCKSLVRLLRLRLLKPYIFSDATRSIA